MSYGKSSREKFYEAVRGGFLQRCMGPQEGWSDETKAAVGELPAGANEFRHRRISDIAREFCERGDLTISGQADHEIIRTAIGQHEFVRRSGGGPAFNTTGSFSNLMLDAANKTLRQSFDEAPSTYQRWVRQGKFASDFKTLHRIIFGEMSMPEDVPENQEYPEQTTSDARESYKISKKGAIFSISYEALVNDDMDAITRIPQMQGAAMRRKINRGAYSVLLDNDALTNDSIALFHASSHGANLDANALAESALDTGFSTMAMQAGLDSTTVLGIAPRYLIVPFALAATAHRLVGGGVVPQTVANVPLYNSQRPLEVVADGQIDAIGSTTNWWIAADNGVVDTVEITFLQGEETPRLESQGGFSTDTIDYKIRQSYAIKAIDYRGLYQGNV